MLPVTKALKSDPITVLSLVSFITSAPSSVVINTCSSSCKSQMTNNSHNPRALFSPVCDYRKYILWHVFNSISIQSHQWGIHSETQLGLCGGTRPKICSTCVAHNLTKLGMNRLQTGLPKSFCGNLISVVQFIYQINKFLSAHCMSFTK